MKFVISFIDQPVGSEFGNHREPGQWTLRSGECDRATQERGQCDADAGGRLGEQLGVHGDGSVGVEFEGVVWALGAGPGAWVGVGANGIPAVSTGDHSCALSNSANRAQDCVPAAGLQWLAEGLLGDVQADRGSGYCISQSGGAAKLK